MSAIRVPSFLTKLDKEEKKEMMIGYMQWKKHPVAESLVKYLEGELERLTLEDEKNSFSSWFQTRWNLSSRLGKRQVIRAILKDLTGS